MATKFYPSTYVNDHHDVMARVNYPPSDGQEFGPDNLPAPKRFGDFIESSRYMTIHNARGKEDSFKLDTNSFEIVTIPERERDVSTDDKIKEDFLPEVMDILKKRHGASVIIPFGHVLRRAENKFFLENQDSERYNRFASLWPHCDLPVACPERLPLVKEQILEHAHIPADTQAVMQQAVGSASRWAVVQIWKPLKTLQRDPLALCDSLTIGQEDWRFRQSAEPNIFFSLLAHPETEEKHKWYYVNEMKPNEMFIFKGCDSRHGEPGFTGYAGAHTAIVLPDSEDHPPRESIEARFICLWE